MLPQEDAAEFAAFQAALTKELAPVGAVQTVLARRIAIAAWRLARADRMEAEVLAFRSYEGADSGLALMRDANSTRSIETLMRYRGAAIAEFTRALRTLQALQAGPARDQAAGTETREAPPKRGGRSTLRAAPNEPERGAESLMDYALPEPPAPGRALHEPAARWTPNEPEPAPTARAAPAPRGSAQDEPEYRSNARQSGSATRRA